MLRPMDAAQALADLTEISSQVVQVAILDRDGSLLATTIEEPASATRFCALLARLLEEADGQAHGRGLAELAQLEASTLDGSVFVVRASGRLIAATTRPDPTVGLVLYDLKRCLSSLEEADAPGIDAAEAAAVEQADAPAVDAGEVPAVGEADASGLGASEPLAATEAEAPVGEAPEAPDLAELEAPPLAGSEAAAADGAAAGAKTTGAPNGATGSRRQGRRKADDAA